MTQLKTLYDAALPLIAACNERDRRTVRGKGLRNAFMAKVFWRDPWRIDLSPHTVIYLVKQDVNAPVLSLRHERYPQDSACHTDRLDIFLDDGGNAVVTRATDGWTRDGAIWLGIPDTFKTRQDRVPDLIKGWTVESRMARNQIQVRRPQWLRERRGVTSFDEVVYRL